MVLGENTIQPLFSDYPKAGAAHYSGVSQYKELHMTRGIQEGG
jgi:hypothetical protein